MVDFAALMPADYRPRYDDRIRRHREGWLTAGFLWNFADFDEVFAARLRREGIEDPREEMTA